MKNIFALLKKHSWMWIIIMVLIAIIGDTYLTRKKVITPTPSPIPQTASYKGILPGNSTESDLNKIWGTPLRSNISGNEKTNEYKGVGFRNRVAIIIDNKIALIREIVGSSELTKTSSITNIYGNAQNILYSKYPNYAFRLYVYPANGIAYLGANNGTLSEIWYFIPTTIDNFNKTFGQDFQTTPPQPIQ